MCIPASEGPEDDRFETTARVEEFAGDILDRNPHLPVLLSSGYMDKKAQWEVIEEKGYEFKKKPYTLQNLLSGVRNTLRSAGRKRTP